MQLRISDSKIETGDSKLATRVAVSNTGVSMFDIIDSTMACLDGQWLCGSHAARGAAERRSYASLVVGSEWHRLLALADPVRLTATRA
jgi:hypothetical protein